jgi:hypothetical protein
VKIDAFTMGQEELYNIPSTAGNVFKMTKSVRLLDFEQRVYLYGPGELYWIVSELDTASQSFKPVFWKLRSEKGGDLYRGPGEVGVLLEVGKTYLIGLMSNYTTYIDLSSSANPAFGSWVSGYSSNVATTDPQPWSGVKSYKFYWQRFYTVDAL